MAIFYPKMVAPPKQIISPKSVHWYVLVYGKCLMGNNRSMTKKTFCVPKMFFAKMLYFIIKKKKKVPNKLFWGVNRSSKYVQAFI